MKKFTLILAAIFTLHTAILFAGNDETASASTRISTSSLVKQLAPLTPSVATFEDISEGASADVTPVPALAPETPATADFEETVYDAVSNQVLMPKTPSVADFD